MINNISIVFLVLSLVWLMGCADTQNPTGVGAEELIYPLEVGNEWSYVRLLSMENFRPTDTTVTAQRDTTLLARSFVSISRTDTLKDSITTHVLLNVLEESGASFTSESHYCNSDDGLYFFAYQNGGYSTPKTPAAGKILFGGRQFGSVAELTNYITTAGRNAGAVLDSLIIETPPLKTLPREYRIDDQWTYRDSGKPWRLDKKIVGRGVLETHAGSFECFQVRWLIDRDNDGQWDEDVSIVDWVAPEGLIRRFTFFKDLGWTGPDAPSPIGLFDYKDDYTLTGIKLL